MLHGFILPTASFNLFSIFPWLQLFPASFRIIFIAFLPFSMHPILMKSRWPRIIILQLFHYHIIFSNLFLADSIILVFIQNPFSPFFPTRTARKPYLSISRGSPMEPTYIPPYHPHITVNSHDFRAVAIQRYGVAAGYFDHSLSLSHSKLSPAHSISFFPPLSQSAKHLLSFSPSSYYSFSSWCAGRRGNGLLLLIIFSIL